jgi:iron complex transport system substrate-binding protein
MIRRTAAFATLLVLSLALTAPAGAQDMLAYSFNGYETQIPAEPQRAFVMESRTALEFALLAGYPIVATDWDPSSHLQLDPATEKLEFRAEPNAELALSYDPDLLVVGRGWWNYWQDNGAFDGAGFNILVVEDANNGDWKDLMLDQLTAIGRAERAEAALADYEAAVAEARPVIAELLGDTPVAVADIWNNDQYVLHADTFDAAVARDIGLNLVRSDAPLEDGYQAHSAENLGAFADASMIVVSSFNASAEQNPMWLRLPAVQEGKVYDLHLANSWGFALTATDFVHDLVGYVEAAEGAQ